MRISDWVRLVLFRSHVLFNVAYDAGKWKKAADACREVIELAHSVNKKLYEFNRSVLSMTISDTTAVKMSIRNAVTERWNSEIIWANTNSMSGHMKTLSQARVDPDKIGRAHV